jgi:MFS family permease
MGRTNPFVVLLMAAVFVAGILAWYFLTNPQINLKILLIAVLAVIVLLFASFQAFQRIREEKRGEPAEDELSSLLKMRAGSQAFFYSQFLWLFLFLFHSKFADIENAFGIGILGSAAIYGISLIILKRRGIQE